MSARRESAFAALVAQHLDTLYRAAYRLTGNRHDAEDLVQEVCLRAYAALAELQKLDQPKAWLLKVQYRVFLDGARHRRRSPVRPSPKDFDPNALPSNDPGPETLVDGVVAERRLQRAWDGLDKQQRALLALQAEGYSLTEMQQVMDLSTDVLKARLYRARVRLGKLLEQCESTAPLLVES